jgi:RNA polymerase sigma factor (sigma-70 family)
MPLAHRLAWRIARHDARDVPADELVAEALLGLTYAASRYDEARQVPFTAYATRVIRHCVGHAVARWRRRARFVPLAERTWEGDEAWESRERKSPPDPSGRSSARDVCDRLQRALPRRLFQVLYWHHVKGLDAQQISERLGLSRSRAWQLLAKATALARVRIPAPDGDE